MGAPLSSEIALTVACCTPRSRTSSRAASRIASFACTAFGMLVVVPRDGVVGPAVRAYVLTTRAYALASQPPRCEREDTAKPLGSGHPRATRDRMLSYAYGSSLWLI